MRRNDLEADVHQVQARQQCDALRLCGGDYPGCQARFDALLIAIAAIIAVMIFANKSLVEFRPEFLVANLTTPCVRLVPHTRVERSVSLIF